MFIETQGIKNLDSEHRRRLGSSGLRRTSSDRHAVRTAIAGTLVAWAARLAPDTARPKTLRTRAAPN